ncbi:MAG: hypothetical protein AB8H79_12680 [Myxococcota bacterium]
MRTFVAMLVLVGCAEAVDPDPSNTTGDLPIDTTGVWGPAADDFRGVRVVQLRPELADVGFAFNGTGIPVQSGLPAPFATPFLPRTTDDISVQLFRPVDGAQPELVHTTDPVTFQGPFSEVITFGTAVEPLSLNLEIDPTPVAGKVPMRLINGLTNMAYAGLSEAENSPGAPLVSAFYGQVSDVQTIDADVEQNWVLDINGDGRADIAYAPFTLAAQDSAGNGQYVEVFLYPSGVLVPQTNIPVPVLLILPMTGADDLLIVPPLGG